MIKFGKLTSFADHSHADDDSVSAPRKLPRNRSLKEQINAAKVQRQLEGTKEQSPGESHFDQCTRLESDAAEWNMAAALQIG